MSEKIELSRGRTGQTFVTPDEALKVVVASDPVVQDPPMGRAERDIRAAADILDSFADAGEIEFQSNRYSPFRDMTSKCLVSPRRVVEAFSRAYVRAAERIGAR